MRRASIALFVCALPAAAAGCGLILGITDREVGQDAGTDAGEDAIADARETSTDSSPDVHDAAVDSNDAGPEATTDSTGDTIDAAPDSEVVDSGMLDTGTSIDSAIDSGIDSGIDTGTDSGVAIDSGIDTGVDTGFDAGSFTCTASTPPTPASVGSVTYGPTLAYHAGLWGLAWAAGTASISYNAVDSAGTIQIPSADKTSIASGSGITYAPFPRLATVGSTFVLAYGERNAAGSAFPGVQLIDPATGAPSGSAANGTSVTDATANDVGGVAVDATGTAIVTSSRIYGGFSATTARANLFGATPTFKLSSSPTSSSHSTSVGYADAAARFGVAYVVGPASTDGMIATYDASLSPKTSFPFTDTGDQPADTSYTSEVSIAGAGDRFAVAWVDQRSGHSEIVLTSVDALTGARGATPEVQVSVTGTLDKMFPRVVYDGRSLVVAWVETIGAGTTYQVNVRRFALDLSPREPYKCVSCGTGFTAQMSGIGLVVAGPDDYGVAFMLLSSPSSKQYFSHVTCSGP